MKHRFTSLGLALTVGLVVNACSFSTGQSPEGAAEELIADELSEQAGMTFSEADCQAPVDDAVGSEFTCTAINADGAQVTFDGVIDPDDKVFVAPSNLVYTEELPLVEQEAAEVLGPQVGVDIDPADVDCPDQTTVLTSDMLRCEITDSSTGERYELNVTFGEFVLREGYDDRFYEIGDLIAG